MTILTGIKLPIGLQATIIYLTVASVTSLPVEEAFNGFLDYAQAFKDRGSEQLLHNSDSNMFKKLDDATVRAGKLFKIYSNLALTRELVKALNGRNRPVNVRTPLKRIFPNLFKQAIADEYRMPKTADVSKEGSRSGGTVLRYG